ncbi:Oidioi.mRNA.OKI2018_I69.PAR.g12088.t1.cds [Oikopleura dioica]|uniref:Oidioi.mRNA.OKI2018_I69.PAR.g12088.t1.cds n=1 Tax=Oikopleura dioica TaxID=34765 RepID=A0ABN7S636_OIKDI|nr:Oidioi.mRNA.OKI2018_I69.PAR.g12088.t1.cds [Oikopleura dioica]
MFTYPKYRGYRSLPPSNGADTKSRSKSGSDDVADENANPANKSLDAGSTAAIANPKSKPKRTLQEYINPVSPPPLSPLSDIGRASPRGRGRRRRRVTPEAIRALLVGKSSQERSEKPQREKSPSASRSIIVTKAPTVAGVNEERTRRELSPTSEHYFGDMLDDAVLGVGPCISMGHVWSKEEQEEARRIRLEEEAQKERAKKNKERAQSAREKAKQLRETVNEEPTAVKDLEEGLGQMHFPRPTVNVPKNPVPTPSAHVVVGGRRAPFELNWTEDCDAAGTINNKPKRWNLTLKDLQRIFSTSVDTCDGIPASLADTRLGWYLQQLAKIAKTTDKATEQRKQLRHLLANDNSDGPRFNSAYPPYGILETPRKPWKTLGSFYPVFAQDLFGRYIIQKLFIWAFFGDDDWRLVNINEHELIGHVGKLVDVMNALGAKTVFPWPSTDTTSFATYKAMFLLAAGFIPTTAKQPYALEASMANEKTFKVLCMGDEIKQPPCAKQLRAIERSLELRIWRSIPDCMSAVYHLEAKKRHSTDSKEEHWILTFAELQERLNRSIGVNTSYRRKNLTKAQIGEMALIRAMDAVYDALPPLFTKFKFGVTDELVAMFLFGNATLPPTEDLNFLNLFGVADPIVAGLADFHLREENQCEDHVGAVKFAIKKREKVLDDLFQNMIDFDVFEMKENDALDNKTSDAGPGRNSSFSSELEHRRDLAVIEPFSTSTSSPATQTRTKKKTKKKVKNVEKSAARSSFGASQFDDALDTVSEGSFPVTDPFKEAVISLVSSSSSSDEE